MNGLSKTKCGEMHFSKWMFAGLVMLCGTLFQSTSVEAWTYETINGVRVIQNQVISETITIDGTSWDGAIIRNNVFKNQTSYGLYIANVINLTIEKNEFYGMQSFAIKLRSDQTQGTDNVTIQANYFHDMPCTAILSGEPNNHMKILGNTFKNVGTNINASTDQHGIYLKGPDSLVENNFFDGTPDGNGISMRSSGVVRGNLVMNVAQDGIKYYSNSEAKGSGLLIVECNVVVAGGTGAVGASEGVGVKIDRMIVRFNTLINDFRGIRLGSNMSAVDFQIYGNILVVSNRNYFEFSSQPSLETDNLTSPSDIGFNDKASQNYQLQENSIARNFVSGIPEAPLYDYLKNSMGLDPYDAGAMQYVPTITNNGIPPAKISNLKCLSSTTSSITLTWKAPGDDGTVGTAAAYDLRCSTSTITELNFLSASKILNVPTPQTSGSTEYFTVTQLVPGARYYFAIKTTDKDGNGSAISNNGTRRTARS